MPFEDLLILAKTVINSIESDELSDDSLTKLQFIFPESLIIAALDLIDRESVIRYVTPWGHTEYEVIGSTSMYSILLDLDASPIPYFCTCPAFAYSVLIKETHIMCKHILATLLARKLTLCIDRPTGADQLVALFTRHFPLTKDESTTACNT
ncbi:hypothetical protein B0H34DRAFT_346284 [Crassisporium funariophilum]|nr:hypothetical protein B0H34DRAFT_346284 [Crassisporium funariophilum]